MGGSLGGCSLKRCRFLAINSHLSNFLPFFCTPLSTCQTAPPCLLDVEDHALVPCPTCGTRASHTWDTSVPYMGRALRTGELACHHRGTRCSSPEHPVFITDDDTFLRSSKLLSFSASNLVFLAIFAPKPTPFQRTATQTATHATYYKSASYTAMVAVLQFFQGKIIEK